MEPRINEEENVVVKVSDTMTKIKTKEDMINVMRERGKLDYLKNRIFFPKEPGYDGKYFLQVLTGNKKVIHFK